MARLTPVIVLVLLACALPAPQAASAYGPDRLLAPETACPHQTDSSRAISAQVKTMVCMHRYARRHAHRGGIHTVKKLRVSSNRKARDLRRCQDFSHTACGRDAFYWFRRVGYLTGSYGVGENIALGSGELGTARATMRAWLHSSGHRHTLLTARYDDLGIGMVRGTYQGYEGVQFWVAHFGYHH